MCLEAVDVQCTSANGCDSTQHCTGDVCEACLECPSPPISWQMTGQGQAVEVHANPYHQALVRLTTSQNLIRYDANGVASTLEMDVGTGQLRAFAVMPDASIYGLVYESTSLLVLRHFSPNGARIGNALSPGLFRITALAAGADGHAYVAGYLTNGGFGVIVPIGDNDLTLPPIMAGFGPDDLPWRLAADSGSNVFIGTPATEDLGLMGVALYSKGGVGVSLPDLEAGERQGLAVNYVGEPTADPAGGFAYSVIVKQGGAWLLRTRDVDATGALRWTFSESAGGYLPPFVPLQDSMLFGTERIRPSGKKGAIVQLGAQGTWAGGAAVGPLAAVLVLNASDQSYSVTRVDFAPLTQ